MTHEELLEKIDKVPFMPWVQYIKALRAVVELHKPEHSIRGYRCNLDDGLFPCSTIKAIEKELQ